MMAKPFTPTDGTLYGPNGEYLPDIGTERHSPTVS